ncbi:probable protein phosphatase 2C 25 [Ziziphus jujuba]|uniref:Probable protein phosphatase 2C 25 n=1 Tax=Ziziphus jujuba TaxID=326968 RepID=A0ABM3IEI8_ZIZJJ|nr:probable protein phosphatase 2C 25 [Ziziphus jujuba]
MAAEFAAKNLHENIKDQLMMMTSGESEKKNIEEAVKNGYLMTDKNFLKEGISGGTCCLTALIQDHSLVISNAGDCRAVMSRRGVAEALTSDHRPSRKDEKDRIQTLGGYVDCCRGVWRVQGSLAVTRGIGDGNLKQWVIAEPETKVLKIKPDCEFLILGSDGLWDKVSDQEAVDAARPLFMDVDKSDVLSACKQLVDLSIKRGSTDDISVMIIQLGHFVSW